MKLLLENWRKYLDDERLDESISDMLQNVDDLLDQTIQEAAPEIVRSIREREVDEDVNEFIDGAIHGGWEAQTSSYADPPNIGEPVRIMDEGDKEEVTEMYRLGYEWGWDNPDKARGDIPPDVKRQMVEEAIGEFQERITEEVLIDALEKSVNWAKHSLDDVHTILKNAKNKFGWKLVPAIAGIEIFEHAIFPQALVALTGNPAFYVVATIPTLEILAATAMAIAKSRLPKKPEPEPEPGHLDWYEKEQLDANLFENWRKYLDEAPKAIEAIPGTDTQSGRQGSIDYFWDGGRENLEDEKDPITGWDRFQKTNRKDGGNWKGHQVVLFNDPTGRDTFYFLLDGETPIFYIATQPHKDGVITGNVRKSGGDDFKATDFYKWLIDQHGTIYSDTMQSPGGQKIWKWLKADEKVNVEDAGDREKATRK